MSGYGGEVLKRQASATMKVDERIEASTMTQTTSTAIDELVLAEALAIIDRGLADMRHRELVSTDEVSNLLLDVRSLLVAEMAVN